MKQERVLLDWLSQYIDDVTTIRVDEDVIHLFVNGKRTGIITHQKIGVWK